MSKAPEWPDTLRIQAAEGWLSLRNWQEAKAELDKITDEKTRAHPDVLKAYLEVWEASENREAMVRYLEVLILYEPDEVGHRLRLNAMLLVLGRFDEAYKRIVEDLKTHPNHPALLFKLAVTLCMLKEFERAEWTLVILFTLEEGKYERVYLDMALGWEGLEPLRETLQKWKRELEQQSGGKSSPDVAD
ncbi:MAG: hypothetical protein U1F71_17980 [Verrucomicrobiaceae bacterium]